MKYLALISINDVKFHLLGANHSLWLEWLAENREKALQKSREYQLFEEASPNYLGVYQQASAAHFKDKHTAIKVVQAVATLYQGEAQYLTLTVERITKEVYRQEFLPSELETLYQELLMQGTLARLVASQGQDWYV